MSKRNYTQYSKKPEAVEETPAIVAEPVVEPVVEPEVHAVEVKMEPVETPVVEAPKPKTVTGIVANCTKLNVRAKADASAPVVCVIDVASEVTIDVKKSKTEWFKVRTANGAEGYCMRKFVNANL